MLLGFGPFRVYVFEVQAGTTSFRNGRFPK